MMAKTTIETQLKEKAFVVSLAFFDQPDGWTGEESLQELKQLTKSCDVEVVQAEHIIIRNINPHYMLGKGQAQRLKEKVKSSRVDVVVFGRDLNGAQQRNLEDYFGCKTIDRTQLILDVFARRAHSVEGKMQVELAQLTYLLPRLSGKGIELSRQGGGIGTRGPGEQKLETHRRRVRDRISFIKENLQKSSNKRNLQRTRRSDPSVPTIALVGYTNAGKSTLFNTLTHSAVEARNQMFSTLDPTIRQLVLPNNHKVLLVDTVGFLHLLPHHLINAFKTTLQETADADILLHVIDASHPRCQMLERSVLDVLRSMSVNNKIVIRVMNKIDRLDELRSLESHKNSVWVSAKTGDHMQKLLDCVSSWIEGRRKQYEFFIPYTRADILEQLYDQGQVKSRINDEKGVHLQVLLIPELGDQISSKMHSIHD